MGVVKYTGPMASFHCPTNAEIRSLKVHFSPKQEGTGDPSPENVRPIVGWDRVEVEQSGKNIWHTDFTNNDGVFEKADGVLTKPNTGTASTSYLLGGTADVNQIMFKIPAGTYTMTSKSETFSRIFATLSDGSLWNSGQTQTFSNDVYILNIRCGGISLSQGTYYWSLQIELGSATTSYEPYQGETTNYEFGVLGKKNKFNAYDWQIDGTFINVENTNSLTVNNVAYIENYNFYDISSTKGIQRILSFKAKTNSLSNEKASVALSVRKDNGETMVSGLILKLNEKDYEEEYSLYIAPECDTIQFRNWAYAGSLTLSDIQLELGSTATTYEPYDPNHTAYGGWIDLISGEVCEEWFNVEPSQWEKYNESNGYYAYRLNGIPSAENYSSTAGVQKLSNIISHYGTFNSSNMNKNIIQYPHFLALQQDISIEMVEYIYKLATPVTYHLAPTQLQTFLGQNNIWSNADYVEVEYDLHETQEILNRKAFIMANQPHLVAPEAAQLQSFTTDLAAPLKECKVYFEPKQDLHGYSNPWPAGGGKNLFNWNVLLQNPDNTNSVNKTNRIFTPNTYCVGTSWSNYFIPARVTSYSISSEAIMVENVNVYGVGFAFKLSASTTYVISATATYGGISISHYDSTGAYITTSSNNIINSSFTTPANADITVLTFYSTNNNETAIFSNVQLEVGSIKTAYEPYENICPIEGWDELKAWRTGKNLAIKPYKFYRGYGGKAYDDADEDLVETDTGFKCTPKNGSSGYSTLIAYVHKGQTYTLSFTKTGYCARWLYSIMNKSDIGTETGENTTNFRLFDSGWLYNWNTPIQITPTVDGYLYLNCHQNSSPPTEYECNNIQLELGDTATDYEPHNDTTIPITFPTEAGTIYGGYVDLVRGEVVQEWVLYRLPILTNTNINIASSSYIKIDACDFYVTRSGDNVPDPLTDPRLQPYDPVCNRLPYARNIIWASVGHPNTFAINQNQIHINLSNDLLGITDYTQETAATIKEKIIQYMNNMYNNGDYFEFCYKISPIHYTIDPQTLKTLRGTNNIWSSANDNIEIKYWKH